MKLLIIRHADPDYSIDSLTEKGRREAELLADRLCRLLYAETHGKKSGNARLASGIFVSRKASIS